MHFETMSREPWRLRMSVDDIEQKLVQLSIQHYPAFLEHSQCTDFVHDKVGVDQRFSMIKTFTLLCSFRQLNSN